MSLGDIAAAMQGLAAGGERQRQAMRTTQVEDQDFRRQTAENDQFEAMAPMRQTALRNQNRISGTQATGAEGTVDSKIAATNAQNDAAVIGADLEGQSDQAMIDAGAPQAEATEAVVDAQRNTSDDQRAKNKNAIAASMDLDRTVAWAESETAGRKAETARHDRDTLATDQLNGVHASEALARKSAADSARRMAEIQKKVTKARQESGFDMRQFAQQNAQQIMPAMVDAAYMASMGGDAARSALPLINMDMDGDGNPDYEGATSTAIQQVDGEEYLVAVDDDGNLVESATAPGVPGVRVSELAAWAARDKDNKAKTASGKQNPVKLSEIDDLDDISYDLLGGSFGASMEDTDNDGEPDTFSSMAGVVPETFVAAADEMMPKLQNDISAYLAKAQRDNASVAEARATLSSPEKIAQNIYGANRVAIAQAREAAKANALIMTKEAARTAASEDDDIMDKVGGLFGAGDDDPGEGITEPDPALLEQAYNQILIVLMSNLQPRI